MLKSGGFGGVGADAIGQWQAEDSLSNEAEDSHQLKRRKTRCAWERWQLLVGKRSEPAPVCVIHKKHIYLHLYTVYIYIYTSRTAATKGSPMDIPTLLAGLHWAPLESARYIYIYISFFITCNAI